jgi:hypothetical protein
LSPTYRYFAFGLRILSDWTLPCTESPCPFFSEIELRQAPAAFFANHVPSELRSPERPVRRYHLEDGSTYIVWRGIFEFHVSADSRLIQCHSLDGKPEAAFRTYLLGNLLAFALLNTGVETLHASVVIDRGKTIAFLGDSAYGKSTLTAAFLQAGAELLSDDFLVLRRENGEYVAYPGIPRLKLYEHTAKHLAPPGKAGAPMASGRRPKLVYAVERAHLAPSALQSFYALASPKEAAGVKEIRITSLNGKQAYLELTKNSFNVSVISPQRLSGQFQWATGLVKSGIPLRRLCHPRILSLLPQVIAAVRADLEGQAPRASHLPVTRPSRNR